MAQLPRNHRSTFRATDAAVALVSLALLAAVLGPALAQSRGNSQRDLCALNAKNIGLGVANFESARRVLPLASTQPITGKPGDAGELNPAGYSWLFAILGNGVDNPVGTRFYDEVAQRSNILRKLPFDPTVTSTDGANNVPARDFAVEEYLCPSYVASLVPPADPSRKAVGPVEIKLPPISNYHALAGSHFFNKEGLGRLVPPESLAKQPDGRTVATIPFEGSGILPFPGVVQGVPTARGVRLAQITDGTSQTIVFAETVEPKCASWFDGQEPWLVAAWPGSANMPGFLPAVGVFAPAIGWTAEELPKNWTSLGKQWSPDAAKPTPPYLAANRWSGAQDRVWGPSSLHGNVVTHAFGDIHVQFVAVDVDKNLYLRLVTRNGREQIDPGVIR